MVETIDRTTDENPYRRPWRWLWIRVSRNDLCDEFFRPAPWLGAVPTCSSDYGGRVLFTVIPVNVVIDLLARAYRWCRYRKPDRFQREIDAAYSRGRVYGSSCERVRHATDFICSPRAR